MRCMQAAVDLLGIEVEIWDGGLANMQLAGSLPSKSLGFKARGCEKGSGQHAVPGWGSGCVGKRGQFGQRLGRAARSSGHWLGPQQPRPVIFPWEPLAQRGREPVVHMGAA